MAVYVVTWNINKEDSSYNAAREAFIAQVNKYDNIRDTNLETVRFVSTGISAGQLSESLRAKLDSNDRLFVTKLRLGENAGWLEQDVWDWINPRL